MNAKASRHIFRTPVKTKIKRAAIFTLAFFVLKLGVEGIFSKAYAQDNKSKAQSGQTAPQETLQPNEKRIPIVLVDPVADSAAIRQINERAAERARNTGNPVPKLKIEGKTGTFPVDLSSMNTKSVGSSSGKISITIYMLGPAKINVNEANGIQNDGVFKVCGASCFYTVNGTIYVATRL